MPNIDFDDADINNLVNEAAFLAIRQGKAHIEMHQLEEAVELVISGPERKNRVMSEKDRNIIAYHEAGHVLVSMLLDHTDPVHKVSIIPRGQSGGYTLTLPKEDRYFLTESELLAQIMTLLGGRVAESLVLGEMSTGAQNDLRQVADIAHKMVCEYGMSEAIGPISFGRDEEPVYLGRDFSRKTSYSEEFTSTIDKEIRQLIGTAYSKTEGLIRDHLDKLHRISKALLERETLESEELRQLLNWESLLRA